MQVTLGGFDISYSHHENDPLRLYVGPLHISFEDIRPDETPGFWKNQRPWENCVVWKLIFRKMKIVYMPKWATEARNHYDEMRQKYANWV